MKNELVEARLRRDADLVSFLNTEVEQYADIEDDVAPLRQLLSSSLSQASSLATQALTQPEEAERGKGLRNQLTQLLRRLTAGLHAVAASTKDNRLLALAGNVNQLPKLTETRFAEEARRLLSLAPERSGPLSKRRFLPTHYQQAQALLGELRRASSNENPTDRQSLERLLKQNERTIEQLRTYFRIFEQDEPSVWLGFQAAAKVKKPTGSVAAVTEAHV
ncbi:hypothetical protein [Hymenobacter koreensis]|uniref:Uncharacterized protein n=1 Tax=Hymenobacter koreensis TaxID=1084523 RepID=A0ABP8J319_9BACT